MVDAVYGYVCDHSDPDECKRRLDKTVDFVIRLRHSYVDNDRPKTNQEVNQEIYDIAVKSGLGIGYVKLE